MFRFLFQNSRMALAFVVLTVLGAAAMIGTPDSDGLVTRAVSMSESQRGLLGGGTQGGGAAQGQSQAKAAPSVFGDFDSQAQGTSTESGGASGGNPMTAPMAPTALVAPPGPVTSEPVTPESEAEQ